MPSDNAPDGIDKAELFELIVDSATDFAIYTVDVDGGATSWNGGAERLFGYSAAEILGHSADVIFTPEDRAAGVAQDERLRARESGRAADDRWHQRRDGSRFWASGLLMPLRGPAAGFVKIARDLTRQHDADEQLRANEERFRVLATSIPQLVFRTRDDGDRTWGSPQWIDFTGLTMPDSLGLGWLEAVHPDDRAVTRDGWRAARERGEYYVEHRVRRAADGVYRWHQTRARPINGDRGSDWVGTMTDIDDLRGLKDRQQVIMAELQHRTRNLLAVVQAIASQTLRSSSSLDSFGAEFGSRLRALGRVQGILAASDGDIDLQMLVKAELEAHADGAMETDKIVIGGPPVALPVNAAQAFGLAIHELATNAVKYGALAQAPGRLSVTWQVESDGPDRRARLEWSETNVVNPPRARKGYGTELIERALPYQLRAETSFILEPDGLRCTIAVPLGT